MGTGGSLSLVDMSLALIHFQAFSHCSEQWKETEIAAFTSLAGAWALQRNRNQSKVKQGLKEQDNAW